MEGLVEDPMEDESNAKGEAREANAAGEDVSVEANAAGGDTATKASTVAKDAPAPAACGQASEDASARGRVDTQSAEFLAECGRGGLNETLGVEFVLADRERVEARMPVAPAVTQPFGFVHGGATISLLESVASLGSQLRCDLETQLPFGVDVHVRHRKPGKAGFVRGVATFDHDEPSRGKAGGMKLYWTVAAYDDEGDVMSEGVIICRVVDKARLPS